MSLHDKSDKGKGRGRGNRQPTTKRKPRSRRSSKRVSKSEPAPRDLLAELTRCNEWELRFVDAAFSLAAALNSERVGARSAELLELAQAAQRDGDQWVSYRHVVSRRLHAIDSARLAPGARTRWESDQVRQFFGEDLLRATEIAFEAAGRPTDELDSIDLALAIIVAPDYGFCFPPLPEVESESATVCWYALLARAVHGVGVTTADRNFAYAVVRNAYSEYLDRHNINVSRENISSTLKRWRRNARRGGG